MAKRSEAKKIGHLRLVCDNGKKVPCGVAYIPNNLANFIKAGIDKPLTVIVLPKAGRALAVSDLEGLQRKFGDDLEVFRSISNTETVIFTVVMPRTYELSVKLAALGWSVMKKKVTIQQIDGVVRQELANSFLPH